VIEGEGTRIEEHGAIAVIKLNRPERLNAWGGEMTREINAYLDGLNGGGACGAVTIFGAVFRCSKQFWETRAVMSEARLQRGFASSTTTRRPVFSTDS